MTIKATIRTDATNITSTREAFTFNTISARLYQPDKELARINAISKTPKGKPAKSCFYFFPFIPVLFPELNKVLFVFCKHN
jgi:hypothetical protein